MSRKTETKLTDNDNSQSLNQPAYCTAYHSRKHANNHTCMQLAAMIALMTAADLQLPGWINKTAWSTLEVVSLANVPKLVTMFFRYIQ